MQESFSIIPIKRSVAVLSLVAVSLAASIYASRALAMECVNEPDDHLKPWCASIPGGHHPDAPPKEGEEGITSRTRGWEDEQVSIRERNQNLQNTEKYKGWKLTDSSGKGLDVFVNETGAVVQTSDDSHSWAAKQKAGGGEVDKQSITQESGWDYIYFSCDRCSEDRKCETGVGENPRFSFGTSSDPCAQVDRREKKNKDGGWQAVSLCDPACSGGGAITTTEENGGETGEDKDKKKQSSLACKSLSKDVATPELNQKVKFTCQANFSAVKPAYEFRHRVGSGDYTVVSGKASDQKKKATAEVTVNQAGTWEVQCRVCTDDKKKMCTSWGQAQ